jgi:ArsR family transcriptional regulator
MLSLDHSADLLRVLGDPTRVRLLHLLVGEELTVAELTQITRLSQSRVSTHLGRLREAGLVRDRRQGPASYYAVNGPAMPEDASLLWSVLRDRTTDPLLEQDRDRVQQVLRARGATWADTVAGQMERHYSPGRSWEASLRALLGLVRLGRVLDVASGDGALAELVAPRAREVHCLDFSPRVVAAGAARLAHLAQVQFHLGDMHELPFHAACFDQVLLMNALSYAARPGDVLAEATRVLRPGGALAAVTLASHRHTSVSDRYGHLQQGFDAATLRSELEGLGLDVALCEVTSRERRTPHFEIITVHATSPGGADA